jgi:hypothetical protein
MRNRPEERERGAGAVIHEAGANLPWDRITEDYDLTRSGFLGRGLLFMAVSPLLGARLRGRKPPLTNSSP